jgi:hypothetical protein
MKLNYVLKQLKDHHVEVQSEETDETGRRILIVGCAAPSPPIGLGHFSYYTHVLDPGQEDVSRQERDAMRRRLWHGTTDIFGDDEADELGMPDD